MKIIRHLKVICFLLIIAIIFINCASAEEIDELNDTALIYQSNMTEEIPIIENYSLDSENIYEYFDEEGVLYENYSNSVMSLEDDFQNLGVLEISNDNVTILGNNHTLKNTVFYLSGNNITLCNFSMELYHAFYDIDGAGIYVKGNDIVIDNIYMEYYVPSEIEAYGITAVGSSKSLVNNLKIINCNIYFLANNVFSNVNNYEVNLYYCYNALVENNTFTGSFPLKNVNYGSGGAEISSDTVFILGVINSDYTTINSNTLIANVEDSSGQYPTLDGIFIFESNYCTVSSNNLSMFDFITLSGIPNYLYGIDIYRLNNITIIDNDIHMETTGGQLKNGAAYPIQFSGPLSNITVAYNNLFSKSNGPNLGIYSMNYYGETGVYIYDNVINITGLAGEHEWALVAGIETQDDYAYIFNNTIEVHSVRDVGENDNLYGISYRQSTDSNHTQTVMNNTVFSDGFYSVYLLSTVNSTIANNVLVSKRDDISYGQGGYKQGHGSHTGDTIYNNQIINYYDYFGRLYNNAVGNRTAMYRYQENVNNYTNVFEGKDMVGKNDNPTYSSNPTQSGFSNQKYKNILIFNQGSTGGGSSTGGSSSTGDGNGGNGDSTSGGNGNSGSQSGNGGHSSSNINGSSIDEGGSSQDGGLSWFDAVLKHLYSNTDSGSEVVTSYNGNVESNNTESTPDISGSDSALSSSKASKSSSSEAGSSSVESQPKAYDISKKTDLSNPSNNVLLSIVLIIIVMFLLIIGFKRKNFNEKY